MEYFHNSSKGTEPEEWREGRIYKTYDHLVEVDTRTKGSWEGVVAYVYLRLMPKYDLSRDIMNGEPLWDGLNAGGEGRRGYVLRNVRGD